MNRSTLPYSPKIEFKNATAAEFVLEVENMSILNEYLVAEYEGYRYYCAKDVEDPMNPGTIMWKKGWYEVSFVPGSDPAEYEWKYADEYNIADYIDEVDNLRKSQYPRDLQHVGYRSYLYKDSYMPWLEDTNSGFWTRHADSWIAKNFGETATDFFSSDYLTSTGEAGKVAVSFHRCANVVEINSVMAAIPKEDADVFLCMIPLANPLTYQGEVFHDGIVATFRHNMGTYVYQYGINALETTFAQRFYNLVAGATAIRGYATTPELDNLINNAGLVIQWLLCTTNSPTTIQPSGIEAKQGLYEIIDRGITEYPRFVWDYIDYHYGSMEQVTKLTDSIYADDPSHVGYRVYLTRDWTTTERFYPKGYYEVKQTGPGTAQWEIVDYADDRSEYLIGDIVPWAGEADKLPGGWLLCDGTDYPIVDYIELHDVIGDRYNGDDTPEDYFRVPKVESAIPNYIRAQWANIGTVNYYPSYVGEMVMMGQDDPGTDWLLCDGSPYFTSVYPDLFNSIKYKYGGSGNIFNVPDVSSVVPVYIRALPGVPIQGETGDFVDHFLGAHLDVETTTAEQNNVLTFDAGIWIPKDINEFAPVSIEGDHEIKFSYDDATGQWGYKPDGGEFIPFKRGGSEPITATENDVIFGKTFYDQDMNLRTGNLTAPLVRGLNYTEYCDVSARGGVPLNSTMEVHFNSSIPIAVGEIWHFWINFERAWARDGKCSDPTFYPYNFTANLLDGERITHTSQGVSFGKEWFNKMVWSYWCITSTPPPGEPWLIYFKDNSPGPDIPYHVNAGGDIIRNRP